MAQDPAFLFYPGDYLRDTQCLSEKSQVAYDRIMCEHMRLSEKSYVNHMTNIGISQDQLNFFIKRLSDEEKNEVLRLLKKTGGVFQISWVAESICKRRAYSESRRENKKGKPKNISKSYDSHMEIEIENEIVIKDDSINAKEKRKNEFLKNQKWKEEFCMAKNLKMPILEKMMDDFISDCDLKGEPVDSYKKYFLNLFNKNKNGTHQQPTSKPANGKSAGAEQLLASLKADIASYTGSG